MRRRGRRVLVALLLAACSPAPLPAPAGAPPAAPAPARGAVVHDTVRSAALRGNPLGDPADRHVAVYLPPSYASDPSRRYPTVYLLHGFDGDPAQWTGGRMRLPEAMDSLVAAGAVREMIVVMPDGKNALGGSFFANSPATGRWEDFLVREVVEHVDRRYRTVPGSKGRGVAGWSMGGHASLRLAGRHPEVFGAAYALSPCCLGDLRLDLAPGTEAGPRVWREAAAVRDRAGLAEAPFGARLALAMAALSPPDPARPLGIALPYEAGAEGLVPAEPAHSAWEAVSADSLVARHGAGLARLSGIAFDAGTEDGFRHIPASTRALSDALGRAGIPHAWELYAGTHGSHVPERLRTHVLPFFSARLEAHPSGLR
ncbi:MAG TPA: alpha/beta hydrolase-fold protein [Longimicrobiaceae bacterium]|nr:alpha/beta hydrolase-fold protein [Longimicrobiaceae bacterium]